jgi:hypothetical protein
VFGFLAAPVGTAEDLCLHGRALIAQVSVMVATKLELALDQARHETAPITRQSSQVSQVAAAVSRSTALPFVRNRR